MDLGLQLGIALSLTLSPQRADPRLAPSIFGATARVPRTRPLPGAQRTISTALDIRSIDYQSRR